MSTHLPPLTPRAEAFHEAFLNPPLEYGPLPFWFWNGWLEKDVLLRQLHGFKDAGCAGAIIYARHGLRTPYLSPEWMELVKLVAARGQELGLQIWLADDENWPGGVGPEKGDAWYLKIDRYQAAGETVRQWDAPGENRAACAVVTPPYGAALEWSKVVDLTASVEGGRLEWTPPDGQPWEVLIFSAHRYVHADLLAEGAGDRFLHGTHGRYEDALGSLTDAGITGFFSDDIAPVSVWNVPDPLALPWTPALRQDLQESNGSILAALLPLALDVVGGWTGRQTFWETVAGRYEREFFRPVRAWLDSRGLRWAGHLLFEEPMIPQVMAQADYLRMLRYFDLPAVDNLQLRPPGVEHNLAAAAAHAGSKPAAAESFGGSGWGLDLETRRKSFDAQVVRGIDRLLPHGVFYSSAGKRKLENPPSEWLREPFAPLYPLFAGHVRRLCWAMSAGKATPRVAVLYPLRSAWTALHVTGEPAIAELVEEDFLFVTRLLQETQYEFELVNEAAIVDGEVVGDRLRLGSVDFPILILPSCPCIGRAAWDRIMEFLEWGGKIICLGMLPEGFEEGPDTGLQEELMRLAAVEVDVIRKAYLLRRESLFGGQQVYTYTHKNAAGGRFSAFQAGLSTDPEFARGEVRQILNTYYPPDVEGRDASVLYRRRALGGLDLYWIVSTAAEVMDARLPLRGHGAPEIWDTVTGERSPIWQYTWIGADQTVVTVRLQPGEGVLLALPSEEREHVEAANFVLTAVEGSAEDIRVEGYEDSQGAVKAVGSLTGPPQAIWKRGRHPVRLHGVAGVAPPALKLDEDWNFRRLNPNVLVLDEWRYRRDERGGGRILGWHRRPHPDWDSLPPREPLTWFPELEELEREISSYAWFQTQFTIGEWEPGTSLWLALETVDAPVRCWVDGEEMEPIPWRWPPEEAAALSEIEIIESSLAPALDDAALRWIDLSRSVTTGHHTVILLADYRQVTAQAPDNRQRIPIDLTPGRARLMGHFSVQDRPRGWTLRTREPERVAVGSWTEYGYPHYSGAARYSRTLTVPEDYAGCRLFLEIEAAATVVSLAVDGKPVASFPWLPFRADVTSFLQSGATATLEIIVRNTAANSLLGRADASGLLGNVRLVAYPIVQLSSEGVE